MSKYDVAKVRKKLQEKQGSRFKDPNEFKPPQASDGDTIKYRFYVLPPLKKGDVCADGTASRTMELFYVQNGAHWLNNRTHACPRVHDEEECPICSLGFDLMGETDDKDRRRDIARQWLPRTQYAVNVYFPKDKVNPEEVGGKVMWMNASKQLYDAWEACIMNDDAGDPDDPQAFGVFFDEEDGYLFQLQIKKKNKWNDYSTSKFLASVGKRPIASKGGKPLPERIETILSQRHDLYTKFQPRDPEALQKMRTVFESGEPEDDNGFDEDDTSSASKVADATTTTATTKPANEPEAVVAEEAISDATTPKTVVDDAVDDAVDDVDDDAGDDVVDGDDAGDDAGDVVEDVELQSLLEQIEEE